MLFLLVTSDARPFLDKTDEPDEAHKQEFWSEDGSLNLYKDHVREDVGLRSYGRVHLSELQKSYL